MTPYDFFLAPFVDYAFMKRALAASLILGLAGAPLGVFMSLRRMTLIGDALSHAILPGVAVAFLMAGLSVWAMTISGLVAAVFVAALALLLTRLTRLKEDTAFTIIYLLALAGGVTLLSLKGSNTNLLHLLFGNILAVDTASLMVITASSCLTLFVIALFYRHLVIDGFDPDFLRIAGNAGKSIGLAQPVFFLLLMINLVAAFQSLGTLMSLGLMVLPALAARFWVRNIDNIVPVSIILALISAYGGLLLSYYVNVPSGAAIVLFSGTGALASAFIGRFGSVRAYFAQ